MKRLFALALAAVLLCFGFAGCGKKDSDTSADRDRFLYKNGLEEYVKLGDYKNITVDAASQEYQTLYDSIYAEDITNNNLYSDTAVTEGTVQNGDIANIDYTGKKDGVAFDGGTAAGYDLTIGSGSFIPGFEEGLVGKKIGSTVDLNLTFPEEYHSAELAGQAVVFTVKINSVKQPKKPEEIYESLGFQSVAAYKDDLNERTLNQYLISAVEESSEIKGYPESDLNYLYNRRKSVIEQQLKQQGATLADYLQYLGETEDSFKKELTEQVVKPLMDSQMVLYAIFDKEKLSLQKDATTWEEESEAVSSAVTKFLRSNAVVQ